MIQQSDIQDSLKKVLGGVLQRAEEERRASDPYQLLFATFKDQGLGKAILQARREMSAIALNLHQLVKDQSGKSPDQDLYYVLLGLPLVMTLLKRDIQEKDGISCSADKATLLLRQYFHEKLGLDIEAIPFE